MESVGCHQPTVLDQIPSSPINPQYSTRKILDIHPHLDTSKANSLDFGALHVHQATCTNPYQHLHFFLLPIGGKKEIYLTDGIVIRALPAARLLGEVLHSDSQRRVREAGQLLSGKGSAEPRSWILRDSGVWSILCSLHFVLGK